ncbi:7417_t:CDS:2, partial [Scutellospora calospora]
KNQDDIEYMDNNNIKQIMFDIITGSNDSTAHTYLFVLYHIYKDSIIKSRVYEEIDHVFSNNKSLPIDYDDLKKLIYIDTCINKFLRLLLTVPALFKQATHDGIL